MKDIKKGLTRLVGVAMSIGITCSVIMMAGCKDKGTVVGAEGFSLQAFSDVNTGREYDSKYFYRNDLNVFGGDADVIYVSEEESEEYGGYFYMYTSGNDGVVLQQYSDHRSAITCLRSKDLNDWELCGAVDDGFSCYIENSEWILARTWAPEVVRNPQNGKYYMYYTAQAPWHEDVDDPNNELPKKTTTANAEDQFNGAVLVSDTPVGPFYLANSEEGRYFNGQPNLNGDMLGKLSPQINIYGYFHNNDIAGFEGQRLNTEFSIIDISPIVTSTGELYITFARHRSTNHPTTCINANDPTNPKSTSTQCLWVMKMKEDWVTPDYETLTMVADIDYKTVTRNTQYPCWDEENGYNLEGYFKENQETWENYNDGESNGEGNINEGAQLFEKDGRFYLCYSPRGYASRKYDVKQAISDTGIYGPYTKLPSDYARVFGTNLAKNDPYIGMTGTGHHAFVEVNNELFCVYYAIADPLNGDSATNDGRVYAVDRLDFVNVDGYGQLMYGNGPTSTLQFKPDITTGLHNVMLDEGVSISVTNGDKNTIKYLNDNKVIAQNVYNYMQFSFKDRTEITINFATPKEISAISVANAYEYDYGFSGLDGIIFNLAEKPSWYPEDKEYVNKAYIKDIGFNESYCRVNDFGNYILTGAASNVSFSTVKVNSITIVVSDKLSSEGGDTMKISEIKVLGK